MLNCTEQNICEPVICLRPKRKAAKIDRCEADSVDKTIFFFSPSIQGNPNIKRYSFATKKEKIDERNFFIVDVESFNQDPRVSEGINKISRLILIFNNTSINEGVINELLRGVKTDNHMPITLNDLRMTFSTKKLEQLYDEMDLERCYEVIEMLREEGILRKNAVLLLFKLLLYSFSDKASLPRHYCSDKCYRDFVIKNIINSSALFERINKVPVKFFLDNDESGECVPKCFDSVAMHDDVGFIMGFMIFQDLVKKINIYND